MVKMATCVLILVVLAAVVTGSEIKINESENSTANQFTATILPNVVKPPGDRRLYRAFELTNKMKVIIVSDPKTDKGGAALNVMTGSYHDPNELLGMAHYLEHMLFLGTAKFPGNEYEKYLAQYAGSTNAYTEDDNTCYYFTLSPEGLGGAVERFAQLFIAPLFTKELNEREVNAVNSEYEGTLVNEHWRKARIDQFLSNSSHPYSRFSIGNKKTLWTQPMNMSIDVRTELIKFYEAHYSSNLMNLAVIGRESLDQLQAMVEKYFDPVPNKNVPIPIWPDSPYGEDQLQRRIDMVPLMDLRHLYLTFPIPDYTNDYKTGALEYIMSLIRHGGPGSLSSLLKEKKWVSDIYAYSEVPARGFAFFGIAFSLTPQGLENIDDIVLHTFQYLTMLREEGPQKWFWEEMKLIKENQFRFKEEQEAGHIVQDLAALMPDYPIDEIWTSQHLISDYQPNLINKFLALLTPQNVRILTQTKDNQKIVTHKEEFMQVEYAYNKIDPNLIQKWTTCGSHAALKLPQINNFIPSVFDLKQRETNISHPKIIHDDQMSRVWFLQDDEFNLPHVAVSLDIMTPLTSQSARNDNLQTLFVKLIGHVIKESIYPASETGYHYDIHSKTHGITLLVYGYDDKFPLVFNQLLEFLVNFQTSINPAKDGGSFDDVKETYVRAMENTKNEPASSHAYNNFRNLMHSQGFSYDERLASVKDLTLQDVMDYAQLIFQKVRLQWIISGNMVAKEALQLHEQGLEHFKRIKSHSLSPSEMPLAPTLVKLPIGSNYLYNENLESEAQTQSAVKLYFQSEMVELRDEWLILMILDQIMREPCFNILRTKEQLGYSVSCFRTSGGTTFPGYEVSVQGGKHPNFTETRIHHFLQDMAGTVNNLTLTELLVHKKAVQTVINSGKPKTLLSKAYGMSWDMEKGTYDFDKENELLKALDKISLDQVLKYFNTWINPQSTQRKLISIHVTSNSTVMGEGVTLPEYLNRMELVEEPKEWKARLGFYPNPKPYTEIPPWTV